MGKCLVLHPCAWMCAGERAFQARHLLRSTNIPHNLKLELQQTSKIYFWNNLRGMDFSKQITDCGLFSSKWACADISSYNLQSSVQFLLLVDSDVDESYWALRSNCILEVECFLRASADCLMKENLCSEVALEKTSVWFSEEWRELSGDKRDR